MLVAVTKRARRRRGVQASAIASALAVLGVVVGVAVATTGGAGNSSQLATRPTPSAQPTPDLVMLTRHVKCPQRPVTVPAAELRAFRAVTVVTCSQDPRDVPGDGQWLVDVRRVATGGVAGVQAAFASPDEQHGTGGCTLNLVVSPPLILVDTAGRTLSPHVPVDRCDKPQQQFTAALADVSWREVSARKVRQLVTAQAQLAGCPQQYKNMTFEYGPGTRLSSGGALFMREPAEVHLCVYRTPANDLEVGTFERGLAVPAAKTNTLLDALSGPGVGGSCSAQRQFAVVVGGGQWATVELGGCWRVARSYPTSALGSADAATLTALLRLR